MDVRQGRCLAPGVGGMVSTVRSMDPPGWRLVGIMLAVLLGVACAHPAPAPRILGAGRAWKQGWNLIIAEALR
jgi:hypothetical protein